MPPLESSQLRFLEDAANLLGGSSPSTTAHLLTAHTHILHNEFKSLGSHQTKHHCAGCGSLRTRKSSKLVRVKPKKGPKALSRDSATVYKCGSCNQRAVIPRKRSGPRGPSKGSSRGTTTKATAPAVSSTPSPTPSTPVISSQQDLPATDSGAAPAEKSADNSNSKKRAKARKQGGLQALLAAKKSSQSSLDLFDFLQ